MHTSISKIRWKLLIACFVWQHYCWNTDWCRRTNLSIILTKCVYWLGLNNMQKSCIAIILKAAQSYFGTFNRPTYPLGFRVQHVMVTVCYTSVWGAVPAGAVVMGTTDEHRWKNQRVCVWWRDGLFVGLRPRQPGFLRQANSKWWLFLRE